MAECKFERLVSEVNESRRIQEQQDKLRQILNSIDGVDVSNCEGELVVGKKKKMMMILFVLSGNSITLSHSHSHSHSLSLSIYQWILIRLQRIALSKESKSTFIKSMVVREM